MKKLLILIILLIISSCVKETDCGVWSGIYPGMSVSNLRYNLNTFKSNGVSRLPEGHKRGELVDEAKEFGIYAMECIISNEMYTFEIVDDKVYSVIMILNYSNAMKFGEFIRTNDFYEIHSASIQDGLFYYTRYSKLKSGKKNEIMVYINKNSYFSLSKNVTELKYKIEWENLYLEDIFEDRLSKLNLKIYFKESKK